MPQTRQQSLYESAANVAIGYSVAVLANLLILPAYGLPVTTKSAASMGGWFTVVSLVRSYLLRRAFNRQEAA